MSATYTATATAVGGRNGHVETSDGLIKFDLSIPKELGGPGKPGTTNPEAMFAAGYSACFGSAVDAIAKAEKIHADKVSVTAAITIHHDDSGFFLSGKLSVKVDGVDHATAEKLVEKAHQICPYSKATRGNVEVELVTL